MNRRRSVPFVLHFPIVALLNAPVGCASSSKRGGKDTVSGLYTPSEASSDPDAADRLDDADPPDTTAPAANPFVGRLDCQLAVTGPGLPADRPPIALVVTSTDLGDGQVRWDSTHEPGKGASMFEVCPAVLAVDGNAATLVPDSSCVVPYSSGTATVMEGGAIEAHFETILPPADVYLQHLTCAAAAPIVPETFEGFEGPWQCTGTVSGGTGAKSLTFAATVSRPTPDTVQVAGGEGISGAIGFCSPVYALTDGTHAVLVAGQKCGVGALGTPTGGALTLESEKRLTGTLAVDGNTFGTTSFTCDR